MITIIEAETPQKPSNNEEESKESKKEPKVLLGGLDEKIRETLETIRISLTNQEIFVQSGLTPVKVSIKMILFI